MLPFDVDRWSWKYARKPAGLGNASACGILIVTVAGLLLFVVLGISVVLTSPSGEWGGLAVSLVGVLAMGGSTSSQIANVLHGGACSRGARVPDPSSHRSVQQIRCDWNRVEGSQQGDRRALSPHLTCETDRRCGWQTWVRESSSPRPARCRLIWFEQLTAGFSDARTPVPDHRISHSLGTLRSPLS